MEDDLEIIENLKIKTKEIIRQYNSCYTLITGLRKKIKDLEVVEEEISDKPTEKLVKWLKKRDLSEETSFEEFFEIFIKEHNGRLDISKRTMVLNKHGAKLFGYEPDSEVHILELLSKVDELYC